MINTGIAARFPVHPNAGMTRLFVCLALSIALAATAGSPEARTHLVPRLAAGQMLSYQVSYRASKSAKTLSSIVLAEPPGPATADVRSLLRVQILSVQSPGPRQTIHAVVHFQSLDSTAASATEPSSTSPLPPSTPANAPELEFTILASGLVEANKGAEALSPDQQQAWRQWAARFAASAAFPESGVKLGQKWKAEEAEKSPSPIARLTWLRESSYVRDEPCRPLRYTAQGDLLESDQPETCAVILTSATLKQNSSPKDATPDDFQIRQLRTSGTAHGTNQTILYISLKTGLLVRASDAADQSMSLTIAKTDGSNRVHYDVQATSHAQILLVSEP